MVKYKRSNKNHLYPIEYKGYYLYEEDCNSTFVSHYNTVESLGWDKSVYVGSDLGRILPDGEWVKK